MASCRVVARIEASTLGLDIRFVVTSLQDGSAERIYDTLYCARGQAENLIKLHKAQLKSDRTSCRSANANQMRLILHTAAYWLMWKLRHAMPATAALRTAEFATIRLRLIKLAARVIETATRIRVAFASACPKADTFRQIARALCPAPTWPVRPCRRHRSPSRSSANLSKTRDETRRHDQVRLAPREPTSEPRKTTKPTAL